MSEMRWHPLLGEWVVTATHRLDRTFLPPVDYCPLCPTKPGGFPTEIPAEHYDMVVFENRFPSFQLPAPSPAIQATLTSPVAASEGVCEVVLYTDRHDSCLSREPVERVRNLIDVWIHRSQELGALDEIKYVFIFENRGEEIGVTLSHPHGQIYAYPFIPPVLARELANCEAHFLTNGQCLLCEVAQEEATKMIRVVGRNDFFVAYIPFYARWPYEVHIVSLRHVQMMEEFSNIERDALAEILHGVVIAYDALYDQPFPYIMAIHQGPSDGKAYPAFHFHIEFYPPLRKENRLKYLAGSEAGAGVFINDTAPETTAAELRAHWPVQIPLDQARHVD